MRHIFLSLLLLLFVLPLQALELDGRYVLLLVGEHRVGDAKLETLKDAILKARTNLGKSADEVPLVSMGFLDTDTEREYFERLGFKQEDTPVLCVVEWGNPAKFGPKRIVNEAIVRTASVGDAKPLLNQYLAILGLPINTLDVNTVTGDGFVWELPLEFEQVPKAQENDVLGLPEELVGQQKSHSSATLVLAAKNTDENRHSALALVRIDRPNKLNKRIRRMAKMFSRRVSNGIGDLKGPSIQTLNGYKYFKFEKTLLSDGAQKRRDIYFYAPESEKVIYVLTVEDDSEDFIESAPLFLRVVEGLRFTH